MAYTTRSKDNAGDNGRAADQNASIDNEAHFLAAITGPHPPASTGGMVRQFVKLTGIADAVTTEFCTVTTTNEAGDTDGGFYAFYFDGFCCHGEGGAGASSGYWVHLRFCRAMDHTGIGANSVLLETTAASVTAAVAAERTFTSLVYSIAETSEYITSVRVNANVTGTDPTTASTYGMVTLVYSGFTTAPVITSIG